MQSAHFARKKKKTHTTSLEIVQQLRRCGYIFNTSRGAEATKMAFEEWLTHNLNSPIATSLNPGWNTAFPVIIWCLWRWRNNWVFREESTPHEAKVKMIKAKVDEITNTLSKDRANHNCKPKRTIMVCWKPPPERWLTLNTDDSVATRATGGGLLRDQSGNWIKGVHGEYWKTQ